MAGAGKTHLAPCCLGQPASMPSISCPPPGSLPDLARRFPRRGLSPKMRTGLRGLKAWGARRAAEEALFHGEPLHGGRRLMVSGDAAGGAGGSGCQTREPAAAALRRVFGVAAPDDALLAALLVKLFADRQILVAPDLIQYLAT